MRKRFKIPSKVEVRYSPGKGRGVFATKPIRRGEVIERAPGLLVPVDNEKHLEKTFMSHYWFQRNDNRRYVVGLGYVAVANHSEDANTEFDVTTDAVALIAIRPIKKGAEVTVDYNWTDEEWASVGGVKK